MANSSLLVCTKIASLLCGVNVTLNDLDPGDCAGFMEEGCGWSIQQDSGWSRFVRLRVWLTTDVKLQSHYMKGCVCAVCLLCFHRAAESGLTWLTPSHHYRYSFLLSSPIDLSQNKTFYLTCRLWEMEVLFVLVNTKVFEMHFTSAVMYCDWSYKRRSILN